MQDILTITGQIYSWYFALHKLVQKSQIFAFCEVFEIRMSKLFSKRDMLRNDIAVEEMTLKFIFNSAKNKSSDTTSFV